MTTIKAMTGNNAVSFAAAMSKPDLIAAYPITPQSSVVEKLSTMVHNGEIDSTIVQVESEHSAMSVLQGASMAGGRVFTATSGNGLHLMFEPYLRQSTLRLPMVMALATRELMSPHTVFSGQQDAMTVREGGWIQVYCENNQELFDMILQGYRIAEHEDVLLPINVCYDGFYLSHLTERVELPEQSDVDDFVGKFELNHITLDPDNPMSVDPMTPGDWLMKYRESHVQGMQDAKKVIEDIDKEFAEKFGRSHGGLVEEYMCEDADVILVTIGAHTGDARLAVNKAREEGKKVGLLKVRFMRPFPSERVQEVLKNAKAYAVVDRSVSFGWNSGPLYMEVRAALSDLGLTIPNFAAIGGLGGSDITEAQITKCVEKLEEIKEKETGRQETMWLE